LVLTFDVLPLDRRDLRRDLLAVLHLCTTAPPWWGFLNVCAGQFFALFEVYFLFIFILKAVDRFELH